MKYNGSGLSIKNLFFDNLQVGNKIILKIDTLLSSHFNFIIFHHFSKNLPSLPLKEHTS